MAEDSPNLPLKALHPLLEDGTEGRKVEADGRKAEDQDYSDLVKIIIIFGNHIILIFCL